jgi:hypothetical protein
MTDWLKPYQFKPGQPSANPSGKPAFTEDERLAYKNCKRAIAMLGTKTPAEIAAIANDPKALAIEKACAKLLKDYFEKGNSKLIELILNRLVGKEHQVIELTGAQGVPLLPDPQAQAIPDDVLKAKLKEILEKGSESK